jgi:hypothetical protein
MRNPANGHLGYAFIAVGNFQHRIVARWTMHLICHFELLLPAHANGKTPRRAIHMTYREYAPNAGETKAAAIKLRHSRLDCFKPITRDQGPAGQTISAGRRDPPAASAFRSP